MDWATAATPETTPAVAVKGTFPDLNLKPSSRQTR